MHAKAAMKRAAVAEEAAITKEATVMEKSAAAPTRPAPAPVTPAATPAPATPSPATGNSGSRRIVRPRIAVASIRIIIGAGRRKRIIVAGDPDAGADEGRRSR